MRSDWKKTDDHTAPFICLFDEDLTLFVLLSSAKTLKKIVPLSNLEEQEKRFESFGDVEMKQNISLLSFQSLVFGAREAAAHTFDATF